MTTPAEVVARRRAARQRLIGQAERFAEQLNPDLGVRGVVAFGSVARGDWNDRSDVDVLVVGRDLPDAALERLAAVGIPPARVEPVVWSVEDWRKERERGNPIARETIEHGIWILGSQQALASPPS